jgi:membrane protease YdiL (CAAX protease family)
MLSIRTVGVRYFIVLYYLFLVALYFATRDPQKPFDEQAVTYSIIIFVICGVLAAVKMSPVRLFGLSLDKLSGRLFLFILPVFLVSNVFLIVLDLVLNGTAFEPRSFSVRILLNALFPIGQIRAFGEELVFRGFLLSKTVSRDKKVFWAANVIQTLIFTSLHGLIPMPLGAKIVLILFVVTISILYGLLNRKFQSLLPSAILHSTNGLIQNVMSIV